MKGTSFTSVSLFFFRFEFTSASGKACLVLERRPNGTVVADLRDTRAGPSRRLSRARAGYHRRQDHPDDMIQDFRPTRYEGVRILVAEESSINRRLSRLLLEMIGCRVTAVATGFEAVEAFRNHDFDLVLMDCNMPGLDGFQATEKIRAVEHARGGRSRVPIVAVTAFALPTDRNFCIRSGMDDCLIKPVRRQVLVDMLGRWLNVQSLSA